MSAVSVRVEGAATLEATTDNAIHGLQDMSDAGEEAGRIVAQRASSGAPKLSGVLSRSIHADVSGAEVTVTADASYAVYMEYGVASHNIAAHPYMRPALADSQSQVLAAYAKQVRNEVGSIRGT